MILFPVRSQGIIYERCHWSQPVVTVPGSAGRRVCRRRLALLSSVDHDAVRWPNGSNGEAMKLTSVPGIRVLHTYERAWLPKDVVAGLVLTALLVPQGMAYAELAGLPPITGLYTSILCLTAYALMGPSRNLVLGPDSSLGPMIAATILPLIGANGDPAKAVMLASMLALLVGAIMLLAGLAHSASSPISSRSPHRSAT